MSKYSKQHYEEIAKILAEERNFHEGLIAKNTVKNLIYTFANLFVADNPPSSRCSHCGDNKGETSYCIRVPNGDHHSTGEHNFGGFDREKFLKACGLEVNGGQAR